MSAGSRPDSARLPKVVASAAVVIASALVETASADTRGATLGVRVTVVAGCGASSAEGPSTGALDPGCRGRAGARVVAETARTAPIAGGFAVVDAPPLATAEEGGGGLRYVTVIY